MGALAFPLHWSLFLCISLADLVVIKLLFLFSPIWVKTAQFTTLPKTWAGAGLLGRASGLEKRCQETVLRILGSFVFPDFLCFVRPDCTAPTSSVAVV